MGPLHTISLADAREKATSARQKLLEGFDPIGERDKERTARKAAVTAAKIDAARSKTFKEAADAYMAANRAGWKNPKPADQWFSTFNETRRGKRVYPAATVAINDLPVSAIDTALVLAVLEPIWTKTPESASRIRGRLEVVLDFAKVRGLREGENPARWKENLQHALGGRSRAARIQNHRAMEYRDLGAFMDELRARPLPLHCASLKFGEVDGDVRARHGTAFDWSWRSIRFEAAKIVTRWPSQSSTPARIEARGIGGRPPAADWHAIEEALEREIQLVGFPRRDGAPGWRYQADVERWVEARCGNDEPGRTGLKRNTKAMLGRIENRLGGK